MFQNYARLFRWTSRRPAAPAGEGAARAAPRTGGQQVQGSRGHVACIPRRGGPPLLQGCSAVCPCCAQATASTQRLEFLVHMAGQLGSRNIFASASSKVPLQCRTGKMCRSSTGAASSRLTAGASSAAASSPSRCACQRCASGVRVNQLKMQQWNLLKLLSCFRSGVTGCGGCQLEALPALGQHRGSEGPDKDGSSRRCTSASQAGRPAMTRHLVDADGCNFASLTHGITFRQLVCRPLAVTDDAAIGDAPLTIAVKSLVAELPAAGTLRSGSKRKAVPSPPARRSSRSRHLLLA